MESITNSAFMAKKSVTNRAFMAKKKMYKKPQTETQPMQAAGVLCVSGDGRVGVDNSELTGEKLF